MSDLLYSDVESELRESVRGLLAQRSPVSQVLARIEANEPYDQALWRTLVTEMGLAGMAVPERFGGSGASLREAAVVVEELGRGVAPVPFLSSAIVATTTLLASYAAEPLRKVAAGESIAVLGVPFLSGPHSPQSTVTAEDGRLTGSVALVADGLAADLLLILAADGLYLVDATADGVSRTAVVSLDLTRPLADLRFDGAAGQRIAEGDAGRSAVAAGLTAGAALLASEQLGLAEWCLETTVDYVKQRYQFGRPIGSFQAVKHRIADIWVDLTQARAVARYAAVCAAEADDDLPVAASLAQAFCSPFAVKAAEECVQLHGGIGFTWEHPAHLFLKRARADAVGFGSADRHRHQLAGLVDLSL